MSSKVVDTPSPSPEHVAKRSPSVTLTLALLTVAYLVAAVLSAMTQRPWCDEAWNSSPALSLITRGYMGTPALDWYIGSAKVNPSSAGIDRYTYWIMPLHPLTQAGWYAIVGYSVLAVRAYSMVWGLVALFSWFVIVRRLTGDTLAATIAFGLMATDFIVIQRSSEGRMDILSAALGFMAIAVYLSLRDRRFMYAVVLSQALICASCMAHPNGIMPLMALAFLTLYFDWRRIRISHLAAAAVPYAIGLLSWWLYISQAPEFFRVQLSGNASGRFDGFRHPLTAVYNEWVVRILPFLAGFAPNLSAAHRVKIVVLAAYSIGIVGALSIRDLRSSRPVRALLIMTAIYLSAMIWWDGMKIPLYLIHIVPFYLALLGIVTAWVWRRWPTWRRGVVAAGVLLIIVQLSGTAFVVHRNSYAHAYTPAVNFLKEHGGGNGAHVMGSAELGFELGFFENLSDDIRLGLYTGKKPDYIVIDSRYAGWIDGFRRAEPATFQFVQNRLTAEYRPVFNNVEYTIYARN